MFSSKKLSRNCHYPSSPCQKTELDGVCLSPQVQPNETRNLVELITRIVNTIHQLATNPLIKETNLVIYETNPVILETNLGILETNPVLLEINLGLLETNQVILETNIVILETNPVIFETNPGI